MLSTHRLKFDLNVYLVFRMSQSRSAPHFPSGFSPCNYHVKSIAMNFYCNKNNEDVTLKFSFRNELFIPITTEASVLLVFLVVSCAKLTGTDLGGKFLKSATLRVFAIFLPLRH